MRKSIDFIKVVSLGLFFILAVGPMSGQSPIGIWEIIEDGEPQSHIEIYESNGKIHGKVVKLLKNAKITHFTQCNDDRRNKSLLGMDIIKDLVPEGDTWVDGKILDPKKCKEYKCQIELKDPNTLEVRGYIGVPVFGKSQSWYRVNESDM